MAFDDDNRDSAPRVNRVIWKCRRCGSTYSTEIHRAVSIYIREAIEHRTTVSTHECDDDAIGIVDLLGTPGTLSAAEALAKRRTDADERPIGRLTGAERGST